MRDLQINQTKIQERNSFLFTILITVINVLSMIAASIVSYQKYKFLFLIVVCLLTAYVVLASINFIVNYFKNKNHKKLAIVFSVFTILPTSMLVVTHIIIDSISVLDALSKTILFVAVSIIYPVFIIANVGKK